MAERAIASAVEKIVQLLVQEATFVGEVRGEVEWLRTELCWLECFMEDADAKRRRGARRVKNWVREIRDVAYQAEDAVDTYMLKIESRSRGSMERLRRYACIPCKLTDLHDIGNEILQIKDKTHHIKQSREAYGIINLGENRAEPSADERFQAWRQSSSRLDDEAVVVGFDVNKKFIRFSTPSMEPIGLLSTKDPTVYAWRLVAENKGWESGIQVKQILAMSYNHLQPRYLKSCFLYLGCFPEDYKIKAAEVIRLWIAEGFIPPEVYRTFEETAQYYLEELAQRCMIQVVQRSKTTKSIKFFRIHHLFREWCILEAKEEGFFRICSSNNDIAEHDIISSRRLVLYGELQDDIFNCPTYKTRTILGFDLKPADKMFLKNVVQKFNLLRVIHLYFQSDARFHKNGLPEEISSLILLRHILIAAKRFPQLESYVIYRPFGHVKLNILCPYRRRCAPLRHCGT